MPRKSIRAQLTNDDGILLIPEKFSVLCRTTEFKYRLSLPPIAAIILGVRNTTVILEIGKDGTLIRAKYSYRLVKDGNPIHHFYGDGWSQVVDLLEITQGDTLHFTRSGRRLLRFRVEVQRYDGCVILNPEVIPQPHIVKVEPDFGPIP